MKLVSPPLRPLFVLLGYVSLILGLVGALLPLVPTSPFLLLAAFFFSKGSHRLHKWILNLPRFGPAIRDWEIYSVVPIQAKVMATLMKAGIIAGLVYFNTNTIVLWSVIAIFLGVLIYIWTRPSKVKSLNEATLK